MPVTGKPRLKRSENSHPNGFRSQEKHSDERPKHGARRGLCPFLFPERSLKHFLFPPVVEQLVVEQLVEVTEISFCGRLVPVLLPSNEGPVSCGRPDVNVPSACLLDDEADIDPKISAQDLREDAPVGRGHSLKRGKLKRERLCLGKCRHSPCKPPGSTKGHPWQCLWRETRRSPPPLHIPIIL